MRRENLSLWSRVWNCLSSDPYKEFYSYDLEESYYNDRLAKEKERIERNRVYYEKLDQLLKDDKYLVIVPSLSANTNLSWTLMCPSLDNFIVATSNDYNQLVFLQKELFSDVTKENYGMN